MHFMPIHVARNHAFYGVLQEILHSERPETWLFTLDVLWCDMYSSEVVFMLLHHVPMQLSVFFLCVSYMIGNESKNLPS